METITVALPEHIIAFIEQEIAVRRFDDESAAIGVAIEQLMPSSYRWEEDEALLNAIAEYERDGGTPWTPVLREKLLREARKGVERGDPVPY
jgi:Arc/MetJ-type ribon-helix-helix transcriptional regulator